MIQPETDGHMHVTALQLNVFKILFIIIVVVIYVVELPVLIFVLYTLYIVRQDWTVTNITKRGENSVTYSLAIKFYWHFVAIPDRVMLNVFYNHVNEWLIREILLVSTLYCSTGLVIGIYVRLLYYNPQLHRFEKNQNWKMAIDQIEFDSYHSKFFFKHARVSLKFIASGFIFTCYHIFADKMKTRSYLVNMILRMDDYILIFENKN